MYSYVRLILHDLGISLPHEGGFSEVKNAYIKSAYYSICDNYGVNADETWMHGDWFYATGYGIFGHEVKATKRSPPDSLTRCIITQSKGFTRKGIEKISRSARAYVYLVFTSQVEVRSSTVGDSAPAVDAQQVFKSTFKALINEDYSIVIDTERYQGVLEHALSKEDFSVGTGIYMLPSDLNLNIGKTKGYNNKILVSNTGMKIDSNKDINKDHKKSIPPESGKAEGVAHDAPKMMKNMDKPVKDDFAAQHDNLKMLAEKHIDDKLAITHQDINKDHKQGSQKDIRSWLAKQALCQVHMRPPKEINHPHYDVTKPNEEHQFDLLYMPHNVFEGNTYKYILTGIDVASRYKIARPLKTKKSSEVAFVLEAIYKKGDMFKYPKVF